MKGGGSGSSELGTSEGELRAEYRRTRLAPLEEQVPPSPSTICLERGASRESRSLFNRALAEEDVEVVHDLRVCSRRLQQCLAGLYPNPPREIRRGQKLLRRVRHGLERGGM